MKKRFLKNLAYGAVGLGLLVGTQIILPNNNILKPGDFSKAKWIEFYNANGRIENCYRREDVPRNQYNLQLYSEEVSKRNKGNLEGMIWLPDLDDDGKVGKIKNPNLKN
jgi:hypothetical protein